MRHAVVALGLVVATAVGCGTEGPADEGLRPTVRAYAQAFLRGDERAANELRDEACDPFPAGGLDQLAEDLRRLNGGAAVHVTGVRLRAVTRDRAEGSARYDVPRDVQGNDNWLTLVLEDGRWSVSDCTEVPFGGHSESDGTATIG